MLRQLFSKERGATAIIVALIMVVLTGFAALVVDAGVLFEQRRQLQNAVDAAALAGAQQIPIDVTQAKEQAYVYAEKNGVARPELVHANMVSVFNGGDGIRVRARREVPLFFAPVLGMNSQFAEAEATAILTKIEPEGIWPWGVTQDSIGPGIQALKLGARNSMIGNFMALDFPSSSGADSYREYIMYKYQNPPPNPVPPYTWLVDTETGNVAGPTVQGVSWVMGAPSAVPIPDIRHPRVGLLPVLSAKTWDEVQGKAAVEIVDFAVFIIQDVDQAPAGLVTLYGSFVQFAYGVGRSTNVGAPLEGLIGARLWE